MEALEKECLFLLKNKFDSVPENIKRIKIDVGIHKGKMSQNWLNKSPDLFVFGFEPHEECAEKVKNKINNREIPDRLAIIPYAVDNDCVKNNIFFWTTGYTGCSSLLKPNSNLFMKISEGIEEKNVISISLNFFFQKFPWDRFEYIEYLKIDAQGKDLDILKSAGEYLKERVVFVTAEPETIDYENSKNNNVTNIVNYMISQNFILINHPMTTDPTFLNRKFINIAESIYIYQT